MLFKFPVGQIVATPGALEALGEAHEVPSDVLHRHRLCDWGDLDQHDKRENDRALKTGDRLLSAYKLSTGVKVWVITEGDRSATTLLLPEDY